MHGSQRHTTGTEGPPAGPRYRRYLAEQPRPAASAGPDPFSSGTDDTSPQLGPVIQAGFDSECSSFGCPVGAIWEGDDIRADGEGGWIHAECAEEDGLA